MNLVRLVGVAAVFMGWQLAPDGPLAYYIGAGLLIAWLALERAVTAPGKAWAVYAYAAFCGLSTSTCGAMYAAGADARHFLCDRGTGLPVSLLSGLLALAAVLYLSVGGRDG